MDFLEKGPHTITVRGRIVREYGGTGSLTPHMIETSLARMVRYVHLIDAVLAAEYPDFELVGSFFVFKVAGQIHNNGGRRHLWLPEDLPFIEQCIKRLATAFSVSESDLRCQLDSLLSLATEIFKQGCTEEEAIKKAWQIRKKKMGCVWMRCPSPSGGRWHGVSPQVTLSGTSHWSADSFLTDHIVALAQGSG